MPVVAWNTHELDPSDVSQVATAIKSTDDVETPKGYDDIDLAAIDAIFSIGVRYKAVENVLGRYRGIDGAPTGTLTGLIDIIDSCGGPSGFATKVSNHGRTSTRNGILKAEALRAVADEMAYLGLNRQSDLKTNIDTGALDLAKGAWTSVAGQRSGISWRYFLMLNRIEDVKPDRMITRFCTTVLERPIDLYTAAELVTAAAEEVGQSLRHVDHRIWHHQRNSSHNGSRRTGTSND